MSAAKAKKATLNAGLHYDTHRHVGMQTKHGMALCHYLEHKADPEKFSAEWVEAANKLEVTQDRSAVTCKVCKPELEESSKCFGCQKAFPLTSKGDWDVHSVAKLDIVSEISGVIPRDLALSVFVCGIRSDLYYLYSHSHSHKPKTDCERKARERAAVCPGCGDYTDPSKRNYYDTGTKPGTLCGNCYELLRRAKAIEAQSEGELKRYVIPARVIVPHLWGHKENESDPDWHLATLLARIATGVGKKMNEDDSGERLLHEKGSHDSSERGPSVELTPDQAAAFRELGRAIHDVVDAAYRKGAEEGRSVLFSLASGSITIDQLNERQTRIAKRHELADDKELADDEEEA